MRISELEKRFDGFELRVGSMHLEPGAIHGLIGPNGSGKTTLMKLVAGLMRPDSGEIDAEGLTARDITMVPRKPYLLHDSVERNLVYPLRIRGVRPDPELVDHYLNLAGLQGIRKRHAPSLSSGEQQKLALVRALISSPRLILIDEGFSNLDIESVELFEQLILGRQRRQPATWLVISHQLAHIQRLCGHIWFMDAGRLEAHGGAADMLMRPENPKLRRYLQCEGVVR